MFCFLRFLSLLSLCSCRIYNFVFVFRDIFLYRDTFACPVLFSLWRIRRKWLRNVVKRCNDIEVQREMFKCLGKLVYSIWKGDDTLRFMEELTRDFVDQTDFMEYFRGYWMPKIG